MWPTTEDYSAQASAADASSMAPFGLDGTVSHTTTTIPSNDSDFPTTNDILGLAPQAGILSSGEFSFTPPPLTFLPPPPPPSHPEHSLQHRATNSTSSSPAVASNVQTVQPQYANTTSTHPLQRQVSFGGTQFTASASNQPNVHGGHASGPAQGNYFASHSTHNVAGRINPASFIPQSVQPRMEPQMYTAHHSEHQVYGGDGRRTAPMFQNSVVVSGNTINPTHFPSHVSPAVHHMPSPVHHLVNVPTYANAPATHQYNPMGPSTAQAYQRHDYGFQAIQSSNQYVPHLLQPMSSFNGFATPTAATYGSMPIHTGPSHYQAPPGYSLSVIPPQPLPVPAQPFTIPPPGSISDDIQMAPLEDGSTARVQFNFCESVPALPLFRIGTKAAVRTLFTFCGPGADYISTAGQENLVTHQNLAQIVIDVGTETVIHPAVVYATCTPTQRVSSFRLIRSSDCQQCPFSAFCS